MTDEYTLRAACIQAVHRFCDREALPLPPHLVEQEQDGVVRFLGTTPDGRQYAIGYERATPAA